jgi:hypothetical protein
MKRLVQVGGICLLFVVAGCYHATINTGRQPSGQTIHQPWAHSFIAGLIPPKVVETASTCPNGVARVETQHSILNMLAQFITFSIYSPITITVQCAGGAPDAPAEDIVRAPATDATQAMVEAVNRSLQAGRAIFIDLE